VERRDANPSPLDLSIVVPAFEEEQSLPILHREIGEALQGTGLGYELLFVDDGSGDRTPEVLRDLARTDPRVRVLRQTPNRGQSAALAAGWNAARAPVVVMMDADLQNDPADIPELVERLEGWDVVSGIRVERRDTWVRRLSSRIANAVRRRVTGDSATDVGCTLRACRTELLRRVPVFDGMHRFLPALLEMDGARMTEVPVRHRARRFGTAKYGIRNRLGRGILDLFGVWWLQRRWVGRRTVTEVTDGDGTQS
jgi:glycosyltransferase involved in cell wall biosynthesis